jgi:ribosomal protein L37E
MKILCFLFSHKYQTVYKKGGDRYYVNHIKCKRCGLPHPFGQKEEYCLKISLGAFKKVKSGETIYL